LINPLRSDHPFGKFPYANSDPPQQQHYTISFHFGHFGHLPPILHFNPKWVFFSIFVVFHPASNSQKMFGSIELWSPKEIALFTALIC